MKQRDSSLMRHVQNSGGAWHSPSIAAELDMVRLGIALYGLQPSAAYPIAAIKPVARLVAPITAIHEIAAGTGVGYGHTFIAARASRIAVVPVGYADGYPRLLGNRASAECRKDFVPVVGRVSMDQITLDITDVPAAVGEQVTLMSNDTREPHCVDRLAEQCQTIGYELATRWGGRLHRRVCE